MLEEGSFNLFAKQLYPALGCAAKSVKTHQITSDVKYKDIYSSYMKPKIYIFFNYE